MDCKLCSIVANRSDANLPLIGQRQALPLLVILALPANAAGPAAVGFEVGNIAQIDLAHA